jgi:hypothetical protein
VEDMKMKKSIYLALIIFLFSYCGPKQDKVERIIEDGVEVVINPIEPYVIKGEPSTLRLEEEFTIDFEREDLADKGITNVIGFDGDSHSNIYFMISRSSGDFIFKFDGEGNYLSSFGRRGQGPGELETPRYLRVNELDQIAVSDISRNKLCLFEKNGDFIKEIPFTANYRIATPLGNGNILAAKGNFNREEGKIELPIILCDEELEEMKMLHPGRYMPNFTLAKRINALRLYRDYNVWKILKGLIYIGNYGSSGYEFLIYDIDGNLVRKIRKEYQKVKVPDQEKEKILDWLKDNFDSFEQFKGKIYFPEFYPPFQFFFLDEEGRLYVMTYEKGKGLNDFIYDIFNPDGVFIGRIELGNYGNLVSSPIINPLPLNVVARKNRLYCLKDKDSGYMELVVYKMRWE